MNKVLLFLAQGFGIGRIPFAPGTFGSVVGIGWFALLLLTGNLWLYLGGTILGLALSVWLCGAGEKILKQKDPGSVVMDEIAAIPICFLSLILMIHHKTGSLLGFGYFVSGSNWVYLAGVFLGFRFFDIVKPWPVRQSQSLAGGWGITVDDFLAALYVSILVWIAASPFVV